MRKRIWITGSLLLAMLLALPIGAWADDEPPIAVTNVECDSVSFASDFLLQEEFAPYTVRLEFGDDTYFEQEKVPAGSYALDELHDYPSAGEFAWNLIITDVNGDQEKTQGEVAIDAPFVTLNSTPSPPLLTIHEGEAPIEFITSVSGGVTPYSYSWDLDEDGFPDPGLSSATIEYKYSAGGNYTAAVTVTDYAGCSNTDTLTVVVVDPEADPQDACHPTAQKIAEAVSIIFLSDRAESTYTCEDIFNIFEGALTGYHTGFGRLWHAYQLTQTIPDLTWEEIRDWKLDGSSWGALTQLNRIADTLDGFGIRNLFDLVLSGENSVGDIRTAARAAVRYEADFGDALIRLSEGANSGELGQFYKLAAELDVDPATLDEYLADGASLSELRHAAKLSERTGSDWTEVMDAKGLGSSWSEIGQAYKLADDENSVAEILTTGVKEFRATQREEARLLRDEERAQRSNRTAQPQGTNDRDLRTANQVISKYGVTLEAVMAQFAVCGQDWNCVQAFYRDLSPEPHGKDKKK